jgi:hypothetical protein
MEEAAKPSLKRGLGPIPRFFQRAERVDGISSKRTPDERNLQLPPDYFFVKKIQGIFCKAPMPGCAKPAGWEVLFKTRVEWSNILTLGIIV